MCGALAGSGLVLASERACEMAARRESYGGTPHQAGLPPSLPLRATEGVGGETVSVC